MHRRIDRIEDFEDCKVAKRVEGNIGWPFGCLRVEERRKERKGSKFGTS